MKQLQRSRSDRVLLGVCGGVARYFGIDADVVRAGWILAILAGGVGVIPYVAAYFLMPEATDEEPTPAPDRVAKNLGLLLIAVAGAVLLRQLGIDLLFSGILGFWSWRIIVPIALAIVGVFLVWPRTREAIGFSGDRKLRRSVSNRVLAGVAGGIGEETGVDANLVRIALVAAAVLSSGIAVVLYLLLVVVLPEEDVNAPAPVDPATSPAPSAPAPTPPPPSPPAVEDAPSDQAVPPGDRS